MVRNLDAIPISHNINQIIRDDGNISTIAVRSHEGASPHYSLPSIKSSQRE